MSFSRNYEKYLDLEDFDPAVHQFIKDYICTLCTGIYHNPVTDECDHVFCKKCIHKHLETSKYCPYSSTPITVESLRPIPFITNLLNKYKIKCKNSSDGCDWKGPVSDLESHFNDDCKYHRISCPNEGCLFKSLRENLKEHSKICDYIKYDCPNYCSAMINKRSADAHRHICLKEKILCSQGCGEDINRDELERHLKLCKNTLIECNYHILGCEVKVSGISKADHMLNFVPKHMNMIFEKMIDIEKRLKSIEEKPVVASQQPDKNTNNMLVDDKEISENGVIIAKKKENIAQYSSEKSDKMTGRKIKRGRPPKKAKEFVVIPSQTQNKPILNDFKYLTGVGKTFSLDAINHNQGVLVLDKSATVIQVEKNRHQIVYTNEPMTENNSLIFRINKIEGWLAVGLCYKDEILEDSESPINLKNPPHGFYLISSNGYSWNTNLDTENNIQLKDFNRFTDGTEIKISLNTGNILRFSIGSKNYFISEVSNDKGELYPCVIFLNKNGDSINIK